MSLPSRFRRLGIVSASLAIAIALPVAVRAETCSPPGFVKSWASPGVGGMALDANGNVYVSQQRCSIVKFTTEGGLLDQWNYCSGPWNVLPGPLAVDASGNVFTTYTFGWPPGIVKLSDLFPISDPAAVSIFRA